MGRIVVDSSAWSVALRRSDPARLVHNEAAVRREVQRAAGQGEAVLLGLVLQELLSGVTHTGRFEELRDALRAFDHEPVTAADHERAAQMSNQCRAAGVQGSVVDFLICAVAERLAASILTLDNDFDRYAVLLPVRLHTPT